MRAARFAMNCYDCHQDVTDMLNSHDWPTFEKHRDYLKIITMYKIISNIVHNYSQAYHLLTPMQLILGDTSYLKMQQPTTRIDT